MLSFLIRKIFKQRYYALSTLFKYGTPINKAAIKYTNGSDSYGKEFRSAAFFKEGCKRYGKEKMD